MNKFINDNKRKLIIALILIAISCLLLMFAAMARYSHSQEAYTKYDVADFNTVILGYKNEIVDGSVVSTVDTGFIEPFGSYLEVDNLVPGMQMYTSKSGSSFVISNSGTQRDYDFAVSNGTTTANLTQVDIQYTVRIRATNNMPLKYTLGEKNSDGTYNKLYSSSSGECVNSTGGNNPIYEYYFKEGSSEKVFKMSNDQLELHQFTLFVEWPKEYNNVKYMKEVDTIEVFITASSASYLNDESGTYDPVPNSQGVILLNYNNGTIKSSNEREFEYIVSLSSFKISGSDYVYNFVLDDGVSKGEKSAYYSGSGANVGGSSGSDITTINSSLTFKIPYNDQTKDLHFTLKDADGNSYSTQESFELRDEYISSDTYGKTKTILDVDLDDATADTSTSEDIWRAANSSTTLNKANYDALKQSNSRYKLYIVYTVGSVSSPTTFALNSTSGTVGNSTDLLATKEFYVVMTGNSIDLDSYDITNKLKIYVDSKYITSTAPNEE